MQDTLVEWLEWLRTLPVAAALVVSAILGWYLGTKSNRSLHRRQHTFNAILQASFSKDFQDAQAFVGPYLRDETPTPEDLLTNKNHEELLIKVRFLLNHYEFLSAGVRLGDISEQLFKDSERGVLIAQYEKFENFIQGSRKSRERQAIFEHIEWMYDRWKRNPPNIAVRAVEAILGKPLYHRWHLFLYILGVVVAIVAVLFALDIMQINFNVEALGTPD